MGVRAPDELRVKLKDATMREFTREKIYKPRSLFRYHDKSNEAAIVEKMLAEYLGVKYCVAVNSCSSAMFLALKACQIDNFAPIAFPAFTFTAVPSAIVHAGGIPVPVNCTDNYYIDLSDLERKIVTQNLSYLLLSYMRGHFPDMDALVDICIKHGVTIIEDCAHALGVRYKGQFLGNFGIASCFSSQSAKIIDSGEGGFLATNDPDLAAKAILMAGSYECLWENHIARPDNETMLKHQNYWPCFGLRMHNLTASLLIRQLNDIEDTITHVNDNYSKLSYMLALYADFIRIAEFPADSRPVYDTMQFELLRGDADKFSQKTDIEYFGQPDNARAYWNWGYLHASKKGIFPGLDRLLSRSFDLRLPAKYSQNDITMVFDKIGMAIDE
jgi:dTDP-4-amino-4,6-dideoxygalactose transaminase